MANKTYQIKIESILGGHGTNTNFFSDAQFRNSLGINPAFPSTDITTGVPNAALSSGLIRPTGLDKVSGTTVTNAPMWIINNPKNVITYIYDSAGSAYSIPGTSSSFTTTGISDGGSLTGSSGNGAAYYDNYIYFAKNTTIARYGPLDGTPAFDGDYWAGTLGKTALTNTAYPTNANITTYPNHVMHRHSDGKLYIADVVGNQGVLHVISTTKTTTEGDTDNGSTYQKLTFGYGLWPTCIESYGNYIVVGLIELGASDYQKPPRAKIAFWDTTSQNFNSITWNELADPIISGIKNVNGTLFITTGRKYNTLGFRVLRYIGGSSFDEVAYIEDGFPPFMGAIESFGKQLLFGTVCATPISSGCVYSIGLSKSQMSGGLFKPWGTSQGEGDFVVTALNISHSSDLAHPTPLIGWSNSGVSGGDYNGIDNTTNVYNYNTTKQIFWSQTYRVGQPFKIKKIRIPLAQVLTSSMTVVPKVYLDDGNGSRTLTTINSTNYSTSTQSIVIRPQNLTGDNNFFIEFVWSGSQLCVIGLPITIEYELLDVDTAYP